MKFLGLEVGQHKEIPPWVKEGSIPWESPFPPNKPKMDFQPPGYYTGESSEFTKKLYPKFTKPISPQEVKAPPTLNKMVAANYSAVEIHGFFGLIDDGSDGAGRVLIVHIPRWVRGYFLDIKQGDDLHVYHAKGKVGGVLRVLSTGRHKYYAPGRRVTTCTVIVSEEQWAPFSY